MPGSGAVMPRSFDRTRSHDSAEVERSLEAMLHEYYAYIHRLSLTILDDGSAEARAEADDAAQETFITAYRSLAGFRGRSSLKTWLTAIAVNTCRARLRKRKLRQALQSTLRGLHLTRPPDSPEETAAQNEAHRLLWQAVDSLDEKHRLPVILRYVHALTVPEIAASLGTNEGTIHSRLHYARKTLLNRLGSWQEEAPDEPFA
jgi:RNA polymerase sigma-70 factor (ECF subfamily)